jgi:hypothetical protein
MIYAASKHQLLRESRQPIVAAFVVPSSVRYALGFSNASAGLDHLEARSQTVKALKCTRGRKPWRAM